MAALGGNATDAARAWVPSVARQAKALASVARDASPCVPNSKMAPGRIQAGLESNVLPEKAEFDLDPRNLPTIGPGAVMGPIRDSGTAVQRDLSELVADSEVQMVRRTAVPALEASARADAIADRALRTGARLGSHVAFTTKGGLHHAAGIPTIVCGPSGLARAHKAGEYFLKSGPATCEQIVCQLLGLSTCGSTA